VHKDKRFRRINVVLLLKYHQGAKQTLWTWWNETSNCNLRVFNNAQHQLERV